MKNVTINGRNFSFYNITGKVAEPSKSTETLISSSGGGPYSGGVQVRSATIVHDQLFLIDSNGKEHSFQLIAMNVACREGHELTITSGMMEGNSQEMYLAAFNRTTNQMFFSQPQINSIHLPSKTTKYYFMAVTALLIMISGAWLLVAIAVGALLGYVFSLVHAKFKAISAGKKFIANFRIEDYN